MDSLEEILSFALIIFLLFIILIIFGILNKNVNVVEYQTKNNIEFLSENQILDIANSNIEVLKELSKGLEIIDGPRTVNNEDRNKIRSIYPNQEPLYQIIIRKQEYDLYVIMNQTSVINTVPLSQFR
jgi:hypothetical protein